MDQLARDLARRITDPGLRYDAALIDLASVFEGDDPRELLALLDEASLPLFGAASRDLRAQGRALGTTMFDHLGLALDTDDHRSLLLGHALSTGAADPLLLAVVGHELARRAGLDSVVAWGHETYWTILRRDDAFLPVGYAAPTDADSDAPLAGCCPHEVSYEVLRAITQRGAPESARLALRTRALLPLRPHGAREDVD